MDGVYIVVLGYINIKNINNLFRVIYEQIIIKL